jgi:fatty-acid desaturase
MVDMDNKNHSDVLHIRNIIFLGSVYLATPFAFMDVFFTWNAVLLMVALSWLTSIGITLGFHRYLSHNSFTLNKYVAYFWVFFGVLACQNGPVKWVAHHRMHHAGVDTNLDPHNAQKSFFWAHIGWMLHINSYFDDSKTIKRYTKDINKVPFYCFLQENFIFIQILFCLFLYLCGGFPFLFWGFFVRLAFVYQVTWLVNSAGHKFGYKNFEIPGDEATNCWWASIFSYGDGWHNNHHAYPKSARHGFLSHEIDFTWIVIFLLQKAGMADNIHLPQIEILPSSKNSKPVYSVKILKAKV